MPKAEALSEAKSWLRNLRREEIPLLAASLSGAEVRSKDAVRRQPAATAHAERVGLDQTQPFNHPYYWSAFVLVGDPK
jgi:CHAT domain-containing protein